MTKLRYKRQKEEKEFVPRHTELDFSYLEADRSERYRRKVDNVHRTQNQKKLKEKCLKCLYEAQVESQGSNSRYHCSKNTLYTMTINFDKKKKIRAENAPLGQAVGQMAQMPPWR
jgi:hypothetical protein